MTDKYEDWVWNGQRVTANYAFGNGVHAVGKVVGYSADPTVLIETDDGERVHWLARLCEPVPMDPAHAQKGEEKVKTMYLASDPEPVGAKRLRDEDGDVAVRDAQGWRWESLYGRVQADSGVRHQWDELFVNFAEVIEWDYGTTQHLLDERLRDIANLQEEVTRLEGENDRLRQDKATGQRIVGDLRAQVAERDEALRKIRALSLFGKDALPEEPEYRYFRSDPYLWRAHRSGYVDYRFLRAGDDLEWRKAAPGITLKSLVEDQGAREITDEYRG